MKINLGKFEITFSRRTNPEQPGTAGPGTGTGIGTGTGSSEKSENLQSLLDIDNITTLEFVSHELKGILGSTIMCVYSIRDGFLGMLNFKQRATIETIIRNLRRLESTIKDFLDISKIEGGKLKHKKTGVRINADIIKEVEDAFLSEIYERGQVIENNITDEIIANTDRTLLLTVFNNLISNAIKYGKSGGKITINFKKSGNLMEFSVYNDGDPIKEEDKEKLFKKFSRIENQASKKIKGTGLGLFIVKNIVNTLGGDIRIITTENGNEFVFDIEGE
jgi:signal transduction histidine kinase